VLIPASLGDGSVGKTRVEAQIIRLCGSTLAPEAFAMKRI
jgi:hypothetical protein